MFRVKSQLLGPTEHDFDPETPMNPIEVQAAKDYVLGRYMDPSDHIVNDRWLMKSYAEALNGAPDKTKSYWGTKSGAVDYTEDVLPILDMDGLRQKINDLPSSTQRPDSLVTKDVLSTVTSGNQGGGVLIRQDLVPYIWPWVITNFQLLNYINAVPAGGLFHHWNNLISLGDANDGFLGEFGCPTPGQSTLFRGSTNIGIVGVERGTSLLLDAAIRAGGVLYNGGMSSYDLQMRDALAVRAKILEKATLQGVTVPGHGAGPNGNAVPGTYDEYGQSYPDGYNGLRVQLSGHANEVHTNFYPAGYTPIIWEATAATKPITNAVDGAVGDVINHGGAPDLVVMGVTAARMLRAEYDQFERLTQGDVTANGGFVAGGFVGAIATVGGRILPILVVPDSQIGSYAASGIGTPTINGVTMPATGLTGLVQDIYVLTTSALARPVLGSEDPIPLELPIGTPGPDGTGCLSRRFIVYMMMGFAVYVPVWQAKVRVAVPPGTSA